MTELSCYCGSGQLYSRCCGPLLEHNVPAATTEALMRSRYSANVLKNTTYLLKTWHPDSRPQSMDAATIPDWCGLTILQVNRGQQGDSSGTVEFKALYQGQDGMALLHEKSRFVREDGLWLYVDGELVAAGAVSEIKTGRNAPCPCGSGKKYKKCCRR